MNITDDEALGFMDRLPEWLRQADLTNFGSHIEVVYVSPGAQHVDTQINMGKETLPEPKTHNPETLPVPPRPSLCREGEWAHTPSKDTIPRGAHPTVHRTIDDGAVWRRTAVLPARALAGGVSHTGG